jgi:hypothetical protein
MSTVIDDRVPVRSYARIFKPDRRVYQVEGHRLPVPGGVPLRWLGYATGTLVAVIALSGRSWAIAALFAVAAAIGGWAVGGRWAAMIAAAWTLGLAQLAGFALAGMDWPLRLLIVPSLIATLATQATPDGRPAHRFALSWVALQLRPARRSLGRPVPQPGEASGPARLAVARDSHGPLLRPCRVDGPARIGLSAPLELGRSRSGGRLAHPPGRLTRDVTRLEMVELAAGERLEVRR